MSETRSRRSRPRIAYRGGHQTNRISFVVLYAALKPDFSIPQFRSQPSRVERASKVSEANQQA